MKLQQRRSRLIDRLRQLFPDEVWEYEYPGLWKGTNFNVRSEAGQYRRDDTNEPILELASQPEEPVEPK